MIYLDNAATGFPKPQTVVEEVVRCMTEYGGNPGRGSHRLAMEAAEKIYECREETASLFGVDDPRRVVFTQNATASLNIAVKGLLHEGDHVLISDMEHNSVFRPVEKLARNGIVSYDVFPTFAKDPTSGAKEILEGIRTRIRKNTKLLVCIGASNISSFTMPIKAIGELCKRKGIFFVVDGAQWAGHTEIDLSNLHVDAFCAPGHKGLWGPQGSGILILGRGIRMETLMEGGSGYRTLEPTMPRELPERLEAGTLSTPAIAGLCEGIKALKRVGIAAIEEKEKSDYRFLLERLSEIPDLKIYTPHFEGGILLFSHAKRSADQIGRELDSRGFCVRTGFHCAAPAHRTLGTPEGGAVRVSPGFSTAETELEAFCHAVKEITE